MLSPSTSQKSDEADCHELHIKCKLTRFSPHGIRPAEAPGKPARQKARRSDGARWSRFNGSLSPRARTRLQTPCKDPNTEAHFTHLFHAHFYHCRVHLFTVYCASPVSMWMVVLRCEFHQVKQKVMLQTFTDSVDVEIRGHMMSYRT